MPLFAAARRCKRHKHKYHPCIARVHEHYLSIHPHLQAAKSNLVTKPPIDLQHTRVMAYTKVPKCSRRYCIVQLERYYVKLYLLAKGGATMVFQLASAESATRFSKALRKHRL